MRRRLQDHPPIHVLDRDDDDLVDEAARRDLEQAAIQVLLSAIVASSVPASPWP